MKVEVNIDNLKLASEDYDLVDNIQSALETQFDANVCDGDLEDYPEFIVTEVLEDWKTKYMYIAADLDNTKKKNAAQLLKVKEDCTKDFAISLIKIIDEWKLLLEHEYTEGAILLYDKFKEVLEKYNITEVEVREGDTFDDSIHEAMLVSKTKNIAENNMIIKVMRTGYKINDKIIRYPKVIVSKYEEE